MELNFDLLESNSDMEALRRIRKANNKAKNRYVLYRPPTMQSTFKDPNLYSITPPLRKPGRLTQAATSMLTEEEPECSKLDLLIKCSELMLNPQNEPLMRSVQKLTDATEALMELSNQIRINRPKCDSSGIKIEQDEDQKENSVQKLKQSESNNNNSSSSIPIPFRFVTLDGNYSSEFTDEADTEVKSILYDDNNVHVHPKNLIVQRGYVDDHDGYVGVPISCYRMRHTCEPAAFWNETAVKLYLYTDYVNPAEIYSEDCIPPVGCTVDVLAKKPYKSRTQSLPRFLRPKQFED